MFACRRVHLFSIGCFMSKLLLLDRTGVISYISWPVLQHLNIKKDLRKTRSYIFKFRVLESFRKFLNFAIHKL